MALLSLRLRAMFLAVLAAMFALPGMAGACAALFSPDATVQQSAQRIIFTVDEQVGEISAFVQVNYTGAAEDFAWVVPMPSNPTVEVVEQEMFREIQALTEPRYLFPPRPACLRLPTDGDGVGSAPGSAGGGVDIYQQGQVGPYDFSVVGGDDAAALTRWLRENGYRITPLMEPLIKAYTDERMLFLAMKLQGNRDASEIQPVKMTFRATQPVIPLRLAAVGAEPNTKVYVWIFAARQATPANLQRLTIADDLVGLTSFSGNDNYSAVRSAMIDTSGGQAFVAEYAQPSAAFAPNDPTLRELARTYPYLTRLYGEMSPEEMTTDPAFTLDDRLPDISNVHDLTGRVNPYDCLTNDVLPLNEQAASASSPAGWWVQFRWLLAPMTILVVVVAGVAVAWRARQRG